LAKPHFFEHLRPVSIPDPPWFPDPHVTWMCHAVKPMSADLQVDIVIVGVPFDGGSVSHRKGSRLGPTRIRETLYGYSSYSLEHDADISTLRIADCGNVDVNNMNFEETHERVESTVTQVFRVCPNLLILGGDHSVTFPCIKALSVILGAGKRLGVIDFDAHNDCRADWTRNSGLWVRQIQEMKPNPVRGENVAQIGIRGFSYSPFYRDYIRKTGIRVFTSSDVSKEGIDSVLSSAVRCASDGTDAIYVSVDIDALDQAFAPGTDGPSPGGLTTTDLFRAAFDLGKHPLVRAMDVMEVSPPLDVDNATSKAAAETLMRFLCGLLKRKSR